MCPLLSWLALRAASFLLLKFGIIYWEWNHLPPGPFPFPILGNLWQLSFQLHPAMLLQLAQTHGPMFTVRVGPTPLVVLCGFRAVKEALVSHSEPLPGWPLTPLFRDLVGERGTIVRSTARVIGAPMFSRHFLSEDPFFQELIQAINFGLAFVCTIWCWLNDLFPWPFHCLPGPYQDMFRYQKVVRGYIHREISRHKLRTSEAPKDFISCYLAQIIKATDNPVSTFSEENLIQFNPGHFLDKDGNFVVRKVFLPFSPGHQLPGRSPGLRLEYNFGGTRQPQPQKICAIPCLNCPQPGPREEVL
ncbi:hypothetical protein CapIbe_000460 [Capra ibex]